MNWDLTFGITNLVALGGWLVLILGPRRPAWLAAVLDLAIGLLCAVYLVLFAGLVTGLFDPLREAGAAAADLADYSVAGLRNLFDSPGAVVIGWTHYLALDLFAGWWIAREADRARVSRLAQAPVLLATFLAGPIGLLAWLVLRRRRTAATRRIIR